MVNNPLRSLRTPVFRWFLGSTFMSLSNVWMIRIAQDWLVLDLSHGSGSALGISTALQFLPTLALTPWAGVVVDRVSKLRVLVLAELTLTVLVVSFAVITMLGVSSLPLAYCLIFGVGVCTAFVGPARSSLPADTLSGGELASALSLIGTCHNLGRVAGPVAAGALLAAGGVTRVFLVGSVVCMLVLLSLLRSREFSIGAPIVPASRGAFRAGLRFVRGRRDLMYIIGAAWFITAFGWNSNLVIALMTREDFELGASGFAFLSAAFALGSVVGALVGGVVDKASIPMLVAAAAAFGILTLLVVTSPSPFVYGALLFLQGAGSLALATLANVYVQASVPTWVRGRVLSLYMTLTTGSAPIGAPLLGVIADLAGPRWCYALSGIITLLTTAVCMVLALAPGREPRRRPGETFGT